MNNTVTIEEKRNMVTVVEDVVKVVKVTEGVVRVVTVGTQGLPGRDGIDGNGYTYTHNQLVPADTWEINHNLDKYPSVAVLDSAGSVVYGDVVYNSDSSITITFSGQFSGIAYLN